MHMPIDFKSQDKMCLKTYILDYSDPKSLQPTKLK